MMGAGARERNRERRERWRATERERRGRQRGFSKTGGLGELAGMQASEGEVASSEQAGTPRGIAHLRPVGHDRLCQFKN
jgi:hypothetical protein